MIRMHAFSLGRPHRLHDRPYGLADYRLSETEHAIPLFSWLHFRPPTAAVANAEGARGSPERELGGGVVAELVDEAGNGREDAGCFCFGCQLAGRSSQGVAGCNQPP